MSKVYSGNYNYANKIPNTKKLKVSKDGNIFATMKDFDALRVYIDTLIYGKNVISSKGDYKLHPLGQNFFIKSGTCGKESSDECKGKDRYLYIDNIPTGKIPCMGKYSPQTNLKGLIPGLTEDLVKVNPMAIFNNVRGVGFKVNDRCILQTLPVGPTSHKHKNGIYKETHCSTELKPPECMPNITEFFKKKTTMKRSYNTLLTLFIVSLFCIIVIFGKNILNYIH